MAKKQSLLDRMEANPRDGWKIEDVKALVKQEDLELRSPNGGSHYVVSSPHLRDSLCVPFKRPIKMFYIKALVSYALAHRASKERKGG